MEFPFPSLEWVEPELHLIEEPLKRGSAAPPARLTGIRIGLPVVRVVAAGELEGPARLQVEADGATYRYDLVQFACSLLPPTGEPYKRVFVEISLAGDQRPDSAIAWSMYPSSEVHESERTGSLGLSAELGLFTLSAGSEHTVTEQACSVATYGPRSPSPAWELSEVPGRALRGAYYLALLVRARREIAVVGEMRCTATVSRSGLFFRYEATLPDQRVGFSIGSNP